MFVLKKKSANVDVSLFFRELISRDMYAKDLKQLDKI